MSPLGLTTAAQRLGPAAAPAASWPSPAGTRSREHDQPHAGVATPNAPVSTSTTPGVKARGHTPGQYEPSGVMKKRSTPIRDVWSDARFSRTVNRWNAPARTQFNGC
jgi:hypothetical protein